jgi:hypothetical protein
MRTALRYALLRGVDTFNFCVAMPVGSTYTRAGNATALTSAGVVQTFAPDAPQRTNRGLVLEPAAVNLLAEAYSFDNALWTKSEASATANAVNAPDGTLTADALVDTAVAANHSFSQNVNIVANSTNTLSVFAKAGARSQCRIFWSTTYSASRSAIFELTGAGSVVQSDAGLTVTILAVNDGWYRCSVTATSTTGNTGVNAFFCPAVAGTPVYSGDGTAAIYLWGAKVESGAVDSSPIVATNLLLRSQEFDNASWVKTNASVTANAVVAPDGTTTADTLIADVAGGASVQHRVDQTPVSSAGTQTISVYAKPAGYDFLALRIGLVGSQIAFNLATGVVTGSEAGATGSIQAAANGFYRCILTVTGVAANAIGRINTATSAGNITFVGDGVSGAYLWQAQLEAGPIATSPVLTTSTISTRNLPVFTEPVPAGRTGALLTYTDGTTTQVTGLAPGGTFDVVTTVAAAGKGRFGASELVSRVWRA